MDNGQRNTKTSDGRVIALDARRTSAPKLVRSPLKHLWSFCEKVLATRCSSKCDRSIIRPYIPFITSAQEMLCSVCNKKKYGRLGARCHYGRCIPRRVVPLLSSAGLSSTTFMCKLLWNAMRTANIGPDFNGCWMVFGQTHIQKQLINCFVLMSVCADGRAYAISMYT